MVNRILIILSLLVMSTLLMADKVNNKGVMGISQFYYTEQFAKVDLLIFTFYNQTTYEIDDEFEIGGSINLVTARSSVDSVISLENHKIHALFLDELYFKQYLNNNWLWLIGKLDFKSDSKEIFGTPSSRKSYIIPTLTNAPIDGFFISNSHGGFSHSFGLIAKDIFLPSDILDSGNLLSELYVDYYGGFYNATYFADDKNTIVTNIYAIDGFLITGDKVSAGLAGISYIYDDSLYSGLTSYAYLTASRAIVDNNPIPDNNGINDGYSWLVGSSIEFTVPYIHNDIIMGAETMRVKGDYSSLTTGKYLSLYKFSKNGDTVNLYYEMSFNANLNFKMIYSKTLSDGDYYSERNGIRRIHLDDYRDTEDLRLEMLYRW